MNFNSHGRFKVLMVEDDKEMSEITANFLKDHFGFDLTLACCGEEAICLLNSENDFDLIITDYCMPDGSGKDILDHMNQSKIDTPVILFSGGGYDNSLFNHPKVFSIVEKPLIEQLTMAIYNALNCK